MVKPSNLYLEAELSVRQTTNKLDGAREISSASIPGIGRARFKAQEKSMTVGPI